MQLLFNNKENTATALLNGCSAVTDTQNAISASDLSFSYEGHQILDKLCFELPSGSILLIKGDNGSGKTTLLNLFSGLLKPHTGQLNLTLNNKIYQTGDYSEYQLAKAGLGRLMQNIQLFPSMSVLDNVLVASTPHLTGNNPLSALFQWEKNKRQEWQAKQQALNNLAIVGIESLASHSADKLSVGQMKRVGLARLLQMKPSIWLLDEPLSGLDRSSVKELISLLITINKKDNTTIVIVEHQHQHISHIAHHIWALSKGQIHVQKGMSWNN